MDIIPFIRGNLMSDLDSLLQKAKEFHGEVCAGIVLGARMTVLGMKELGLNPMERTKFLIVYVEIDRCVADAIQAITGCSLGHRTLKYRPNGMFAATFVNLKTGKAVRISITDKSINGKIGTPAIMGVDTKYLITTPDSTMFRVQQVTVTIPPEDMPGMPVHKARCSRCNEVILDNKGSIVLGNTLCSNCAGGSYFTES